MTKALNLTSATDHSVSICIVHAKSLLREGLAAIIQRDTDYRITALAADLVGLGEFAAGGPQLVVYGFGSEVHFAKDIRALRATYPAARIVVIDERPSDSRVQLALREYVEGYLTATQSAREIVASLGYVMAGARSFAPEIGERLVFTASGVRLRPSEGELPWQQLSPREREVMTYLTRGYTVKQCASLLGLQPSTIDNHKTRLMKKLKVHKTVELTRLAIRHGLVGTATDESAQQRQEV